MSITLPRRIRGILAIAFALTTVVFVTQPAQADFTPPNTPKLTKSVEVTAETGAVRSFYDGTNDVIHVLGTSTLTTYDANTLEVKASATLNSIDNETFLQTGNTFAEERSMIFATKQGDGGTQLQAWEYMPADGNYGLYDINIPIRPTVVYNSALDRVYAIETGDGMIEPSVDFATRDPDSGAWYTGSYPSINIGPGNNSVLSVTATTAGALVGTYATTGGGSGPSDITIDRKPIYSFVDTGSELAPNEVPGTAFDPGTIPYPTGLPIGYSAFTPKSDGSITATETNFDAASHKMITLDPSGANPSGFVVNPTSLTLPSLPKFTSFDALGDLHVASDDTLSQYDDTTLFASSDPGATVRGMTAGDGKAYVFAGASSPYKLSVMSFGGYSPMITTDPLPQGFTVNSNSEAKSVSLTSGATGTPTPTARWQKLIAGESTWNDIPGATSPDLTFDATAADNGASYRAVYSNVAGEIATTSALLTVTVNTPALPVIPVIPIVGPPDPAAPQVKNGKSVKLKYKKGKSVRVTVGTVTCASASTCVYTLPKSIKFKIGKKSFKASVKGPATLEPGKSQAIYATVPAGAVKALKGKKSKLTVSIQVANTAGRMHEMAKSIISNIRA